MSTAVSTAVSDDTRPGPDVTIVGGGVAGLVVARDLARAGRAVEVLEASRFLGGCVGPLTLRGTGGLQVTVDAGAESFATRSTAVAELLGELGLTDRIVTPARGGAWLVSPRGAVPLPASGVLGVPGTRGDVARVAGRLAGLRAGLDRVLPASVGQGRAGRGRGRAGTVVPVSLGHLVRARLGRTALTRLVAPVAGGVHSADPDLLDVDAVAPGLRAALDEHGSLMAAAASLRAAAPAGSAVAGLQGGLFQLVTALADDVRRAGGVIRTGVRVERAVPAASGEGWRLTIGTDGSRTEHVEVPRLVLAADASSADRLLGSVLPGAGVPRDAARGGIRLVTLLLNAPALDAAPRGTGVLVTRDTADATGVRAKALTHASAKWTWVRDALPAGHHVVRLSYGHLGQEQSDADQPGGGQPGGGQPDAGQPSASQLERMALHDASRLLGVGLDPQHLLGSAVVTFPAGLPFAAVGHAERMHRVRAAAEQLPGLHLTGAWIAGTGLAAVVADARRTAQAVLDGK